jgi:hypothetical protein
MGSEFLRVPWICSSVENLNVCVHYICKSVLHTWKLNSFSNRPIYFTLRFGPSVETGKLFFHPRNFKRKICGHEKIYS